MEKIRTAIIGCGLIGECHINDYLSDPNAELVALCDIDEARLREMGEKHGIANLYTSIGRLLDRDDIDAVDICLHNNMHAPVTNEVLRRGKHAYCEKPMAGTYADALSMYETMRETGKRLHIQLAFLYSDETRAAMRLIKSGRLGELLHMRSCGFRRRGRPYVDGYGAKEFVNTTTSGGGAMFDMAVYHISQLLFLAGCPELERVCGKTYQATAMDENRRAISGYDVEELAAGFAVYRGGLSLDILESWAIHGREFPGSTIAGSLGGVSFTPFAFHTRMDDMDADVTFDLGKLNYLNHTVYAENAVYDSSERHWIASLQGRCEQYDTPRIALQTQLLQEGLYLSERLGREIFAAEIPQLSRSRALDIPNLK